MQSPFRVALFTTVLSMQMLGQEAGRPAERSVCHVREVLNPAGWKIPGLSKANVSLHNSRWTTGGLEGVFVDILKPAAPEGSVVVLSCADAQLERLRFSEKAVNITEILRFSMGGRVFAYRVTAQDVGIEGNNRVPLASEMMVTFYDEDGAGRFTLMQYPGPALIPSLDVPEWVKISRK
jgi:hypothetical protein